MIVTVCLHVSHVIIAAVIRHIIDYNPWILMLVVMISHVTALIGLVIYDVSSIDKSCVVSVERIMHMFDVMIQGLEPEHKSLVLTREVCVPFSLGPC